MKRTDMVRVLQKAIRKFHFEPTYFEADRLLKALEEAGMKPPCLPSEDCQALSSVYYGGYTVNQWEEDFAKDKKAQEVKTRRKAARERRKARRKSEQ